MSKLTLENGTGLSKVSLDFLDFLRMGFPSFSLSKLLLDFARVLFLGTISFNSSSPSEKLSSLELTFAAFSGLEGVLPLVENGALRVSVAGLIRTGI